MAFKGGSRENKIYAVIAILIIIVIIIAMIFSSRLNEAEIEDYILGDSWGEDLGERKRGSELWGLEQWASYTYKNNDTIFPAFVTLTSFKTLFMMSEEDIWKNTLDTIEQTSDQGITVDDDTKITGERITNNEHKTMYIVYNGTNAEGEMIKIIGETWNCGVSGSSIICIGYAQVTNNSATNTAHWAKIVRDEEGTFGLGIFQGIDGLMFNVKCH